MSSSTWYSVPSTQYLVPCRRLRTSLRAPLTLLFSLVLSISAPALAAPPKLNYFFPAGAQRGQSLTVTASGDFSTWPVQLWADRSGLTASADKDKGKLKVEVAADAIPGTYWLRLYNADGASQLKPFIVGTLPEISETEPNDTPEKPQLVEPRVVVNGKLAKTGDVDGFRVELKQGQTLVASVQANSILGSPMDAVLQVCELIEQSYSTGQASGVREHPGDVPSSSAGRTDREADASRSPSRVARRLEAFVAAQNHDAIGLDPQLAFTAPKDGAYLVRLFAFPATPDSSIRFAGGDDYIYRLTLTTGSFIDHALPLALPREETQVRLGGWNLGKAANAIVPALSNSTDPQPPDAPLAWVWHPDAAGAVALPRIDHPSLISADKSELPDIPVPVTISGRLETPGDVAAFAFTAAKDQKLRVRVAAKALGFPTDPVLSILDEADKVLAEADDTGRDDRDPQLDFTVPADGRYQVLVHDLARRGDLRMVYRLTIEPIQPDFSLSLAADSFVIEKDKPLEVPVTVTVRDGLRESIEIRALGLPPGVTAEPVKFEPTGDAPTSNSGSGRRGRARGNTPTPSGPSVNLILKADPALLEPGGTPIRIEGRTTGSLPLIRTARFPLNLPLAGSHHAAWLTVRK